MGPGRRPLTADQPARRGERAARRPALAASLVLLVIVAARPAAGQSPVEPPATGPALAGAAAVAGDELPADVRAAVQAVRDFTFNYDQPGFYGMWCAIRERGIMPGVRIEPEDVERWADLVDRPGVFRGRPVRVRGTVGRNASWRHTQPPYDRLGPIWEVQLRRPDQAVLCKLLLTGDAGDVPVGATIEVVGWFLQVQQYQGESGRTGNAVVLVGVGPTRVAQASAGSGGGRGSEAWLPGAAIAAILGLVVAWALLKRAAATVRRDPHALRAQHEAPMNLAEDLARWTESRDDGAGSRPGSDSR